MHIAWKKLLMTGLLAGIGLATENYQLVRVFIFPPADPGFLSTLGIDLEGAQYKEGYYWEVVLSDEEHARVQDMGAATEVLIDDLTVYFQSRFDPELARGFGFGSMGGNYTFDEVITQLNTMRNQYPQIIGPKIALGTTCENRTVWAVKISDNPTVFEADEPEVLYTALTHAREPQGMMTVLYFMWHLLENYGSDPAITYLVNHRQLWFVPVVNPDGYVYNQSTHPNGGGMHRKNRFPNGCSSNPGIDLNRNFGYQWGYNSSGSSSNPCDETYRGSAAFSELETQALRDFCLGHNFKLALNYHSYSNLLIHPFGYEASILPPEPDLTTYCEYLNEMAQWNGYEVGNAWQTVGYVTNGDAVDWMYGAQAILAATPEVGSYSDNFWPPTNRILPLAQENLQPNLYWAWMAGPYYSVIGYDLQAGDYPDPGETLNLLVTIRNKGMGNSDGAVQLQISANSHLISVPAQAIQIGSLNGRATYTTASPIPLVIAPACPVGEAIVLALAIQDQSSLVCRDTIRFRVGTPSLFFSENAEGSLDAWNTGLSWGKSGTSYSGNYSLTDSPIGSYTNNSTNILTMVNGVDLSGMVSATLHYWTKWDIEKKWDFGQVQVSTDGGVSWQPLIGQYMVSGSGSGVQQTGDWGYDGQQTTWVRENISLDAWVGQPDVRVRFMLRTDGAVTKDGWYLDEIVIDGYELIEYTLGDVNNDSEINVSDIVMIVNYILGSMHLSQAEMLAADLNFDGVVNVIDIVRLVNIILGQD